MPTVYLLHGFNVRDGGDGTTDRLRPYFERAGYTVKELDYEWKFLLGVRLCNAGIARIISRVVEPGSIGVGHSNGCAILNLAAHYNAPFSQMVYINAALNRRTELAPQINHCHVWHSPSDSTVKIARWLPNHPWGKMGSSGYIGDDERYINYNKEDNYEFVSNGHSDVFEWRKLGFFGPKIVKALDIK